MSQSPYSVNSQNVQNRTFVGAISSAIKAFCLFFIHGLDVANTGVSMAATAVERARDKSIIDGTIEMQDYEQSALLRAAVERQKVREAVGQYLAADPSGARKKEIETEIAELRKAIAAERARITAQDK